MKRLILTAAIMLAGVVAAPAYTVTTSCARAAGTITCNTNVIRPVNSNARVIQLENNAGPAFANRSQEWHDRCKPTLERDQFGVGRYRYTAPGCAWQ